MKCKRCGTPLTANALSNCPTCGPPKRDRGEPFFRVMHFIDLAIWLVIIGIVVVLATLSW